MATEHGLPPELTISIWELFKRVQPLPLMVPIWFSSSSVDNAAETYVFLITEKKRKKKKGCGIETMKSVYYPTEAISCFPCQRKEFVKEKIRHI